MVRTKTSEKAKAAERKVPKTPLTIPMGGIDLETEEVLRVYTAIVDRHNPYRTPNVASAYDEPAMAANYDVTLYDICRKPRQVVHGTLQIDASSLHDELHCAICSGIIRDATVITACLHRFCSGCIQRHIHEKGLSPACPVCNTVVSTRRALRRDETFDQLIHTIYGDVAAYEEAEDARIQLSNKRAFPQLNLGKQRDFQEKQTPIITNKRARR
ncbi:hypothetical protein SDRG_00571 [Saprolegnia diclina VS20]|uniref:RING-type E3 ubiquitin transferase n=1 Tax=Saprolegnia diclina (strain VS20) TaxID=1156394 RepID=T0SIQ2_SAPDV|nr:hypothetical protein SDRG_00571 [Saprolegnia diclina VS20]EQC42852.1 hypothetical protein SDRG_00571 [Saprolegnia diclina VS20]|eukprot:XP_008604275.1 hypothetical protein SDRG_00571 [Saprolegnia diclina VS20]